MSKYLYGISVQGIQNFIFQTNKLREIAGASELVEEICTTLFKEHLSETGVPFNDAQKIIMAAGNIKYVFSSREDCAAFVNGFAAKIQKKAPGVSIAQAVVEFTGDLENEHLLSLENKQRVQRVKQAAQTAPGFMINERSRSTGIAAVGWKKDKAIDMAQREKEAANVAAKEVLMTKLIGGFNIKKSQFPYEMSDLTHREKNNGIAIVHADGNNLGVEIQKMAALVAGHYKISNVLAEFSTLLDTSTVEAAQDAFESVIRPAYEKEGLNKLPIRPIVIGGDDISVIVRGDLAIEFTEAYLKAFQIRTKNNFKEIVKKYQLTNLAGGLTACAGISFIKPTYPFHYGIRLAENLCAYSKMEAKKLNGSQVPSCLTFHKVLSSFVDDYHVIIERELRAQNVYFNYGPYAIESDAAILPSITLLLKQVSEIKRDNSPKSGLRNWLSDLQISSERAAQKMGRIRELTQEHYVTDLKLHEVIKKNAQGISKTHIYDILTIASINN